MAELKKQRQKVRKVGHLTEMTVLQHCIIS